MPRNKKPYPTIADVARAVELSPTTVSFVINNVPYANIPEETRERVWQAVKALGYRRNAAAKVLRTQQTHTIGFVTDEVATTPFAGQVIKGAQELAWDNEKMLIIINAGGNPSVLEAAVEVLLDRQVEGIIYAAVYHQEVQPPRNLWEVPTVLLDCYCADRSLPSVVPDEVGGGRMATELLISQGHRRIGFINLMADLPAAIGRLQGYREALAMSSIAFDPTLVRHGNAQADGGYEQIQQLMRLDSPPTAVFCGNDRTAMGAYDGLRDLGLRVPQDVSIVGFDNQEIIAAYLRPALTTVLLPHYDMGRWAVQHLLNQIEHPAATTPLQHLEPCTAIIRESIRPIAY